MLSAQVINKLSNLTYILYVGVFFVHTRLCVCLHLSHFVYFAEWTLLFYETNVINGIVVAN